MENQENMTYIVDMLKQINQTTIALSQNQTILFEQYKSLNEKMDRQYDALNSKYNSLDKKADALSGKYDSLDKKVDALDGKYDSLDKKVDTLNGKYDSLDKKVDTLNGKYDSLDKKVDTLNGKYDSLDKKVDKYYEENRREHFEIKNILAHIQNDIKDLRTDIDTVYDLEKDSRKKIRHLL